MPLLAAAAWAMMARPAWVVAGLLSRAARARVPLAAGALTAWDVFLDPRMVREGYWSWPGGGRYEGVPASNFAGWFVTGAGVFAAWAALDRDDDPTATRRRARALRLDVGRRERSPTPCLWRAARASAAAGGAAAMGAFARAGAAARLR